MPTDSGLTWTPHLRISWGGWLGASKLDIFSNTMRYLPAPGATPPTEVELQQVANALLMPIGTWFGLARSRISVDAHLDYVKATWVLENGKQRDQNTAIANFGAGTTGGNAGLVIWEQTYALTLRTAAGRGRAHAGRIYPPLVVAPPEAGTPYCAKQSADEMAAAFAECMKAMVNAIAPIVETAGTHGLFAIISPGNNEKGTSPMWRDFSGVVVDRVADIIHARTNRVPRLEGATAGAV